MHALTGIPREVLDAAPRIWVDMESSFGRRIIDPNWTRAYLDRADVKVRQEIREQNRVLRASERRKRKRELAKQAHLARLEDRRQATRRDQDRLKEEIRLYRQMVASRSKAVENCSSAEEIIARVCEAHNVSAKDVLGLSRIRKLIVPRHHAMYEIRRQRGLSYPHIGRLFAGRDHTTVMKAVLRWPGKAEERGIPCLPLEAE